MKFCALAAFSSLLFEISLAYGFNGFSALFRRAITAPAPLSVIADGSWIGNDGFWSTFTFRMGNPAQDVRLLPSTASQQTLVIIPEGCPPGLMRDCEASRGWLFDKNNSKTWSEKGKYVLDQEPSLLTASSGDFGFDSLGVNAQGQGGPTLDHQLIGGVAGNAFYLGLFGLNPRATNYTFNDPIPSLITNLKNNGSIPSLAFGYTAGARYRLKQVTGSLTLGGYDASRFTPNNLSFTFAPDGNRDLVVGLQSITVTDRDQKNTSLLSSGILTFVDSTLPYIYLPKEAYTKFEQTLGLIWDNRSELYLVNDTLHGELIARNPTFTFTLGNAQSGGQTVDIVIPYASFDLQASGPLLPESRYFPLKRAANDSQYVIGRSFLQESYIIVDWERHNFSISQCVFQDPNPQHLIAIPPVGNTDTPVAPQGGGLSTGAIVAIAVAVVFVTLALISVALAILFVKHKRRKRRNSEMQKDVEEEQPQAPPAPPETVEYRKAELDGEPARDSPHLRDTKQFHLDFGSGHTSMSRPDSVSKLDLATPSSELSGEPMSYMPIHYELPAGELSRPEFEDTSEDIRYKTAGARWRQRRAQGSYGSNNSGHDSLEGRPGLEQRLSELPVNEPSKPGAASGEATIAAAAAAAGVAAAASSAPQQSEHPITHTADDAPTAHGAISPPAVSPDPQRSPRDPMEGTLEGNVSPFSNTDVAPFFSPARLQQLGHGQREYEEPLITPPLAPDKEKELGV